MKTYNIYFVIIFSSILILNSCQDFFDINMKPTVVLSVIQTNKKQRHQMLKFDKNKMRDEFVLSYK